MKAKYSFSGPFALMQKVRIKEPGIVGTIIEIRLFPDGMPGYGIEVWEDGKRDIYVMDGWQIEAVKGNNIGVKS